MGWMEFEALWFFCRQGADVFVGCESFEGLESTGEVVGVDEVDEVLPEVLVGLVVEALYGGFLSESGSCVRPVRWPRDVWVWSDGGR